MLAEKSIQRRLECTIRFFQTNPIHYQLDTILTKRLCVTSYQGELIAMRMRLDHWTRLAVVVVAVAGTQTGCSSGWNKSGWKMPGSDMFSWSRKPSESTLAGSSPSLAMPSGQAGSPTSPALRNTPSPVSSTAANAGRPNPYGATGAGTANATGPSFSTPPGSCHLYISDASDEHRAVKNGGRRTNKNIHSSYIREEAPPQLIH